MMNMMILWTDTAVLGMSMLGKPSGHSWVMNWMRGSVGKGGAGFRHGERDGRWRLRWVENSTRRTGLQENVTKSGLDSLSWRCLRDGQVEMSCRWLEFGVWRQVLAGV